jgi:hypothetical protein
MKQSAMDGCYILLVFSSHGALERSLVFLEALPRKALPSIGLLLLVSEGFLIAIPRAVKFLVY